MVIDLVENTPQGYRESGWWRDTLFIDDLKSHSEARPDDVAVVSHSVDGDWEARLTFADLAAAVDRIAAGLLELGIGPGDPVCFQLPNWWHFVAVHLACGRVGAISTPLTPILGRREVEFIVGLTACRVLIVPETFRGGAYGEMSTELLERVPSLEHVFSISGPGKQAGTFEEHFLNREVSDDELERLDALRPDVDDIATIQFTSGTTGTPKGVMHTHNSLYASTRLVPYALGLDSQDVIMMPSPLAHASGFLYGVLMPVCWGMKVVYQDIWNPETMLELVEKEQATWSIGSPPFIFDIIRACEAAGRRAEPLKLFACAGAPIPRHLASNLEKVSDAHLVCMWGLTETGAVTITPKERLDRATDSDGAASPAMRIRIADGSGLDMAVGEAGALLTRGASQFIGYFNNASETRAAVDPVGWLDTGDLAAIDPEGFVRLTGRAKDIVIRGGENIPVVEVESALHEHPMIREVAVIGVPDERLGERSCAVVVAASDWPPTLADIAAFLSERGFAKQYWPERLVIVDSLPRTPAGKVQKFVLQRDIGLDEGA